MLDLGRPEPIVSDTLKEACSNTAIRHGYFTRIGGTSGGIYRGLNVGLGSDDEPDDVRENRARVCRWFHLPEDRLATLHQIHSTDVVVVDRPIDGSRPKADALVTATPGIVLGVLTADCGPILFADPEAGVVGAAHAGWKGAFNGVAEATIEAMVSLGARREAIIACLGPCISGANYEVGPEFVDRFLAQGSANAIYFEPSANDGHRMFDLQAFTLDRLAMAGVRAVSVGECTYADEDRFFSFRRATHRGEPDYGRQISAISIIDGENHGAAV